MARIGAVVVIGGMTGIASIGRIGIIALVAPVAVVGDGQVCAGEGEHGVMVKSGGCPSGFGVALGAVGWELLCGVVGGGCLVVVGIVATVAGVGGIGIIALVAQVTIVGDGYMGTGEWEHGVVVESRGRPSRFRVAYGTIGRELLRGVVWFGCLAVIGIVATIAGVWRIVVVPVVASGTVIGDAGVRSF